MTRPTGNRNGKAAGNTPVQTDQAIQDPWRVNDGHWEEGSPDWNMGGGGQVAYTSIEKEEENK